MMMAHQSTPRIVGAHIPKRTSILVATSAVLSPVTPNFSKFENYGFNNTMTPEYEDKKIILSKPSGNSFCIEINLKSRREIKRIHLDIGEEKHTAVKLFFDRLIESMDFQEAAQIQGYWLVKRSTRQSNFFTFMEFLREYANLTFDNAGRTTPKKTKNSNLVINQSLLIKFWSEDIIEDIIGIKMESEVKCEPMSPTENHIENHLFRVLFTVHEEISCHAELLDETLKLKEFLLQLCQKLR